MIKAKPNAITLGQKTVQVKMAKEVILKKNVHAGISTKNCGDYPIFEAL